MTYAQFLARKQRHAADEGRHIKADEINPILHPWQRDITAWAVRTARAAIWADTGLGKTMMQLEWARLSADTALIVAPLAVCQQTVDEARDKLGISARYVKDGADVTGPGIWVTNYERVQRFPADMFGAVVLDESSILKQSNGKTRTMLIEHFAGVPRRLACSATPAPNDPEELTSQAEWLGRMRRVDMLAAYFIHDQDGWRLKGHAQAPMIRWMSQWAVALTRPSDVGGDDTGYILPGLNIVPQIVASGVTDDTVLPGFAPEIGGVTGRSKMRRLTLQARVERAVELVKTQPGPWILWCGLNDEADALAAAVPGSRNVHGTLSVEDKADLLRGFARGEYDVLITKPSIASQGLNYQHCHRMAFVGLSDSYEQYYQAIRRCYRYGQQHVVDAHVIVSDAEAKIATNVARKERQAGTVTRALVHEMKRQKEIA